MRAVDGVSVSDPLRRSAVDGRFQDGGSGHGDAALHLRDFDELAFARRLSM